MQECWFVAEHWLTKARAPLNGIMFFTLVPVGKKSHKREVACCQRLKVPTTHICYEVLPVRSVLFCVAGSQPVGLVWIGVDVLGLSEVPSGKKLQLLAAAKVQDNEEKKLDDNLKKC